MTYKASLRRPKALMAGTTLNPRALNRATLARQMLLVREKMTLVAAIERLVGLQAQLARPPFIGLWSRLNGFHRAALGRAIDNRTVVRATMMRGTLHLMSRDDYIAFRPVLQPMLSRGVTAVLRDRSKGIDVAKLVKASRVFFDERPCTFAALREHLVERFPGLDERAMGYVVRLHLPLIQTPAAGSPWAYPAMADFAVAESWIGARLKEQVSPHEMAQRYFAAFGPASALDLQIWSGLAEARAIVEALRPKLRTFRDDRGRELFDLPTSRHPAEDEPAPVRFLPEFDNVLLGYADRARIIADKHKAAIFTRNLLVPATFLVDGFIAGTWSVESKKTVRLVLKPFGTLSKPARQELGEEGENLLRFIEPDAHAYAVDFAKSRV